MVLNEKPQLARKYYNLNNSSDDDDSSSSSDTLQILSPIREKKIMPDENVDDDTKMAPKNKLPVIATTKMRKKLPEKKNYSTIDKSTKFSSDSDTDDDYDNFLMNSKRTFEKTEDPKQKKKRERDVQKEKEKLERLKKRKEAKEEREYRKQEEMVSKKRQNEYHYQATGKYSHEEIAVLLDTDLYQDDPHGLVERLESDFLVHPYPSLLGSPATVIQFVRKDKLLGGAKDAIINLESSNRIGKKSTANTIASGDDCGYEHIHYLVLILEPDDFIPLLRRHSQDEEDDYPALESWLNSIRSRWQHVWNIPSSSYVEPKIIFLLRDLPAALDKKWVEYRRHSNRCDNNDRPLPTVKELQDAIQWLLVQFQVECILCPNIELLQLTIHKMTRSLCEKPYTNQVTELECIKKIKQGCTASDNLLEKAKDVWIRQLQQLPGLSESKAQHVVEHYPTCQSLWQSYQREHYQQEQQHDNDNDASASASNSDYNNLSCSSLLENKFSGDNKKYKKLSDSVYRVMTSNNPNEMIL
mmetsp:Transcript_51580/g.58444  ORF Transcript_51580/g.58444 Transcript_51580/m.58444 type:complete len:526 (+) Transcript_51580:40-1617(+)